MSDKNPTNKKSSSHMLLWVLVVFAVVMVMLLADNMDDAELANESTVVLAGRVDDLTAQLAEAEAELAEANDKLTMPIVVEVIYDPNETISQPADPANATRLQWRLGAIEDFRTHLEDEEIFLVAPMDLMNYHVIGLDGIERMGDTDILPIVVDHQSNQYGELMIAVDNSGFIDR